MASAARLDRTSLAGRNDEVHEVTGTFLAATEGHATALLITGEAGVGKTSLVRQAVERVEDRVDAVWASCLPMTSLAVPFLPLAVALRDHVDARTPTPAEPWLDTGGGGTALLSFDGWLTSASRRRPVALVVDDLQWADQSSLDVLMYVLAGSADRRLAVVATVRTDEAEESVPVHRWLADVRRLPRVSSLGLDRLDRPATAEQLAVLLGRQPHQSLVDDVFARTQGNPYLTTLLSRSLSPDARHLTTGLPTELRAAVTRSWHGMSSSARAVTEVLAVAGRPSTAAELRTAMRARAIDVDVLPALQEAMVAGVVDAGPRDTSWFVHPLTAEVLVDGLLPEDRQALHECFAAVAQARLDEGSAVDLQLAIDIADHLFLAGDAPGAYAWALTGAEAAEAAGGSAESLRLLRRALELLPAADGRQGRHELLDRIRTTAERTGEQEAELAAIEELLEAVDRDVEPLRAAELLVRRATLRMSTGREFYGLEGLREAVRLSEMDPASPEHALATAELADAELWHVVPSGAARAERAVQLARACGSPKALTYALTAKTMSGCFADASDGLAYATEAQTAAAATQDGFAFVHATLWGGNSIDNFMSTTWLDHVRRGREWLETLDVSPIYVSWLAIDEAGGRLMLGDWRASAQLLRRSMASSPGPMGDIHSRLTAALLACWQGRRVEAEQHLARADELAPDGSTYAIYPFDAVRAEIAVERHDLEAAMSAALQGLGLEGEGPTLVERLLPLAARALADEVQRGRDSGDLVSDLEQRLRELRRNFPEIVPDGDATQGTYAVQVRAMQAWYDAEMARGLAAPSVADAWGRAASLLGDGQLVWDEAYAAYRQADALLADRSARDEVARCLRRAHGLAIDLEAHPLLAEVEALAQAARIPLTAPDDDPAGRAAAEFADLTPREREVLAHVVAGRTYREIARDLVISEKTVSVHVSNLLRKTGSANRIELAQRAHRISAHPGAS